MGRLEVCTAECKQRVKSLVLLISNTLNAQHLLTACSLLHSNFFSFVIARQVSNMRDLTSEKNALNPSHSSNKKILSQLCAFISYAIKFTYLF